MIMWNHHPRKRDCVELNMTTKFSVDQIPFTRFIMRLYLAQLLFFVSVWICEKILIYICRLVSYITHPTAFFALCVGIRLAAGCAAVMISISVTCILLKSSVFNSSTVIVSVEFCIRKFMLGKIVYMGHMGRFSSAKSYLLNNKSYIPKSFIIILL